MLVIRTVCGNGIGSSLMAANNVKKICEELGIKADVASVDLLTPSGKKPTFTSRSKNWQINFRPTAMSPLFAATSIKQKSPRILPTR
ncbi:phosphotransferase system, lactose/cellobiose-specific IIB subunit [Klebsiella quasipneumoniae]|nr:phosphotransferase system, lactose/cellobiose-specific IIB subunit [Klebsiella quasipneumoniae]